MTQRRNPEEFRAEIRDFFAQNLPADMARRNCTAVHQTKEDAQAWISVLARKGWSVPSWPANSAGRAGRRSTTSSRKSACLPARPG